MTGVNDPSNPGGEGNLDIMYMLALCPFARTTYWGVNPQVLLNSHCFRHGL